MSRIFSTLPISLFWHSSWV